MSCTVEQIAEKKRIAQERLQRARQQQQQQSATTAANLPKPQAAASNQSRNVAVATNQTFGNSASQFLAVNSFYAQSARPTSAPSSASSPSRRPPHQSQLTNNGGKMKSAHQTAGHHRHQPYGQHANKSGGSQQQQQPKLAPVFLPTKTAVCSMISAERFVVEASFHSAMIDVFKTIPSRVFDASTKNWTFHIDDYQLLRDRMEPLQSEVQLAHLPAFVLNLFASDKSKTKSISAGLGLACLNALEPRIASALLPFQRLGVCFGIEKQGRCMIADEMGLGKTYQALALADFYKHDWPLLVCTTAATRDSWVATVHDLLPYVPPAQVVCLTGGKTADEAASLAGATVLVVSYNLMERNIEQLLRRRFQFVILDESHLLKNAKAKSTRAALELSRLARRVVLLTGTPALSRPSELYTQLQIIDPKFFTYMEYVTRYCAAKQNNFGWDVSGQSHLVELNVMLSRKFMIRRTKQQVLFDLGAKNRETVMLDRALIAVDGDTADNMESYATDFGQLKGRQREEVLLQYYRETAAAKAKAVCAYLRTLIADGEKFIVFAHHRVMLDAISACMTQLDVDHMRIDGRTPNGVRTKSVQRFQTDETCRVAVLSLKACNAGITLTATQLVIFAELDWNPSTLAQAESRAHRIGQTGVVRCRYLLAQGTADDVIWGMLQKKQQTLNKAGLSTDDLADGVLRMAPVSSRNVASMLGAAAAAEAAKPDDLSEFFGDDDDVDFGQIEM